MKLNFNKNESGDLMVTMDKELIRIDFDYVEMIQQLISNNNIEYDWGNLETEEKTKLKELLDKIKVAVDEGMAKNIE